MIILMLGAAAYGQEPPPTIASVIDLEIQGVEKQVIAAAEAMPEEKYGFTPESLKIPDSDYKGVRTFGQQVSHIAASNYAIWWRITGESVPDDYKGGNGPDAGKTMGILKFLRDSFALGHRGRARQPVRRLPRERAEGPGAPERREGSGAAEVRHRGFRAPARRDPRERGGKARAAEEGLLVSSRAIARDPALGRP